MSYYDPDPGAVAVGTDFIRQLSTRDLGLAVPLPFVTAAGVGLTPACFAHGRYVQDSALKCFSNLLAVGFHRLELDVYWDVSRQLWSLCPVELGSDGAAPHAVATAVVSYSSSTTTSLITGDISADNTPRATTLIDALETQLLSLRQTQKSTSIPTSVSETSLSGQRLSTGAHSTAPSLDQSQSSSSIAVPSPTAVAPVVELGPYSCSTNLDLEIFLDVLAQHLAVTSNDLRATIKYLILNLHVAATASDPSGPPQQPAPQYLPGPNDTLSTVLGRNVSELIYSPPELESDRAYLNQSWYAISRGVVVDTSYFDVYGQGYHTYSPDGWPCESYIEMQVAKRMLVGIGTVDPQLQDYDLSMEEPIIFPQNYLQTSRSLSYSPQGHVTAGCYYTDNVYNVSQVNSSWATNAVQIPGLEKIVSPLVAIADASNATYCGVSPILNATIGNLTADQDYGPYRDYAQSTVWSWAPGSTGQPINATDVHGTLNRCAALNATSGFWQTTNCASSLYSACQSLSQPYQWSISSKRASYTDADLTCKRGTQFSVPRTSLQNTYLLHQWRQTLNAGSSKPSNELLFLNFNDADEDTCWVVGQNSTCPYLPPHDNDRNIIVPVVAGIIVLVIAALTVFVKCAANRQRSRRGMRRKGNDGWDYEGVPS